MDAADVAHLRRCLALARAARDGGNEPFGSLLVGADGTVLHELTNTVGNGDVTGAPGAGVGGVGVAAPDTGRAGGRDAVHVVRELRDVRRRPVLGGDRALVFALSGEQLADLVPGDGPALRLSSREVFARGNVPIVVEGPCEELAAEAASVFEGFWPAS